MAIKKEYMYAGIGAIAGLAVGYLVFKPKTTIVAAGLRAKGCTNCAGSMNIDWSRRSGSMNID